MNDKKIKYTLLPALAALLLFSCSQEDLPGVDSTEEDSEILFFTSMPGVESRSDNVIDDNSIKNGFYVSAASLDSLEANGRPTIRFKQEMVTHTEGMGDAFRSNNCRWPSNKGNKEGRLRFFAYYPSFKNLSESAGLSEDYKEKGYFALEYNTTGTGTNAKHEYWIKKFKVNEDIAMHSDFVTATVDGSKTQNLYSGVQLKLQHQLSKITLEAYGSSESYDVEIAGVRIGGIATECDFNFEGTPPRVFDYTLTRVGNWTDVNQKKGCVEYIFREGDFVVPVGKGRNNETYDKAVSIMGKGGHAMVIPYDYYVWTYNKNENKDNAQLYFSVLLRVKERLTPQKTLLYPYIEGADIKPSTNPPTTAAKMNVVYLSVETATGKVMKRVYKSGKNFYTKPDCSAASLYVVPATEDVRNYGWAAAVPSTGVDPQMRWNPGFQYFYRLNYTAGVGVQDPADALPGKPIISPIEVTGSQAAKWHTVKGYDNVEIKDKDVNFTIE